MAGVVRAWVSRVARPGLGRSMAVGRVAWRAAALLWPLALALAPAPRAAAQLPGDWVLDSFDVRYSRRGEQIRSERIPAASTRDFDWHGRQDFGVAYPKGSILLDGHLRVTLPDHLQPGQPYTIKVDSTGTIDTPGRDPGATDYHGLLNLEVKCFDTSLCYFGDHQWKPLVPAQKLELAVDLPAKTFTLPTDPAQLYNGLLKIHALLGSSMPNDDDWGVDIYPYYRAPEVTPPPRYTLEVNTDTPRLPPSGASPSTAWITATVRGSDGRPVPGESVQLALDPPDMGQLASTSGVTDAQGQVKVRYQAPTVAQLADRTAVTVIATVPARSLRSTLALAIERYRLALTVDPTAVPVEPVWRAIRVTVLVQDFDDRPVAGDDIQFRVDPPDLGEVIGNTVTNNRAKTDAGGRVDGFFEPAPPSTFKGRDQVTVYATNLTHGGEQGVLVRFLALRATNTWPAQAARDVDLKPADEPQIDFDRALDTATVNRDTVKLETLWHGDLGYSVEAIGSSILLHLGQDPLPDVGLRVKVHVAGGENGVKGRDGSVMLAPYDLYFYTLPRLQPRIVLSQVVDEPRERLLGRLTVAPKPFSVRVEAGLSTDSELDHEDVEVTLKGPGDTDQVSVQQRYYPGRWPPLVPAAALPHGNAALFMVSVPPAPGREHTVRADLRPGGVPAEKTVHADPVTFFVNRWANPAPATTVGVLAVPIISEMIPPYDWRISRTQMAPWAATAASRANQLLPLNRLAMRLGYLADTTCHDPDKCHAGQPTTSFQYWVRQVGRAGVFTRNWQYVVALVPPGFFKRFADLPGAAARPEAYHHAWISGIWSHRSFDPGFPPSSAWPVSLVEAGESGEVIAHALGDALDLPHSSASIDRLAGYDAAADQVIFCDDAHCPGPDVSVMNDQVGFGPTWISQSDYTGFLDYWTSRSGFNPWAGQGRAIVASPSQGSGQSVLVVSGTLRRAADGRESGSFDPLLTTAGTPSLTTAGSGDYAIVLADAGGSALGRYPFQPPFEPVAEGAMASFLCSVPADPRAQSVAVVHGATTVARVARSARAPVIAFTQPAPGATLRGDVPVAWAGQDADGDALTYQLLFSSDGGSAWEPVLLSSADTRLTLTSTLVGNGRNARLRLVASDGFNSTEAVLPFSLDNPQEVLAVLPADEARVVSPLTTVEAVLRDPLDAAAVNDDTLAVYDRAGHAVSGSVWYDPVGGAVIFTPAEPLGPAERYEARLAGAVRTPDGRTLGADRVWFFTTRGQSMYLPIARQSGHPAEVMATPTIVPTRAPTHAPGPSRTPTPAVPTTTPPGPTATPDGMGTAIAATLTALAPRPTGTPDVLGTAVAATLTALAPRATATPTIAPPTATSEPGTVSVTVDNVTTTGSDPQRLRMAFAAGEAVTLWLHVVNTGPAPVTVDVDFTVVGHGGYVVNDLGWSGPHQVPAGASWVKLDRMVPATAPSGAYTLMGSVTYGLDATTGTSEMYLAGALQSADDFANPSSGWPVGQDATGIFGYLDGEYRQAFTVAGRARWAALTSQPSLMNLVVEADTRTVGPANGSVALVFGLNGDGSDYHIYLVNRSGQYAIYRWTGGAWQTLIPPTDSPVLRTGEASNHLLLVRRSVMTLLYANGREVATVTDIVAPAGRAGLYGSAAEAGFEARFDNFSLYGLP